VISPTKETKQMTASQKITALVKEAPALSSYIFSCRQIGLTDEEIIARLKAVFATIER
jgi:hypothetical protein